jgi:hypothetical protein
LPLAGESIDGVLKVEGIANVFLIALTWLPACGRDGETLMIRNRVIAVLILVGFSISAAGTADAVTAAVRAACRGDAIRLCSSVIHDEEKRHACMRDHAAQLSADCIAAMRASR